MGRAEITGSKALELLKELNETLNHIDGLRSHIDEDPNKPEVFETVTEHLPALRDVFVSNEEKLETTTDDVVYTRDNYAIIYKTVKKCQPQLRYIQQLFEKLKGSPNKTKAYRDAVKNGQNLRLETAMVEVFKAALNVAEPPFVEESKTETLAKAVSELEELDPSYEEPCNGGTYVTNYGEGTQSFHNGKGNINANERGMQIIGNTQNATYNPAASDDRR